MAGLQFTVLPWLPTAWPDPRKEASRLGDWLTPGLPAFSATRLFGTWWRYVLTCPLTLEYLLVLQTPIRNQLNKTHQPSRITNTWMEPELFKEYLTCLLSWETVFFFFFWDYNYYFGKDYSVWRCNTSISEVGYQNCKHPSSFYIPRPSSTDHFFCSRKMTNDLSHLYKTSPFAKYFYSQ